MSVYKNDTGERKMKQSKKHFIEYCLQFMDSLNSSSKSIYQITYIKFLICLVFSKNSHFFSPSFQSILSIYYEFDAMVVILHASSHLLLFKTL